ncbi:MAG TPA: anhydro-N-acetylmuramic acid kinase [Chitinophagaceae bacterium]|nr:anhydro-N-acetylmuramic acid kinase [Chitinophagaceae bacterium]
MLYNVIGLMSGSSLDGLDIAYVQLQETAGRWSFNILQADCFPYSHEWASKLANAIQLPAAEYQLLHSAYGRYTGEAVNAFIDEHHLHHQVHLIASHGHTSFHMPEHRMTAQLGDGAAIAAVTGLPVVSDLRAMDIAFGGQGAPIVPIGEKLLLNEYGLFLNLGGIANLSCNQGGNYVAFDVCPANRVLNLLIAPAGKAFDEDGATAARGQVDTGMLEKLNGLGYYQQPFPKSLANDFGNNIVFAMLQQSGLSMQDALCTYTEHIAQQVKHAAAAVLPAELTETTNRKLLVTGGGALNSFLVQRISSLLAEISVDLVVPDKQLINYKEALVMALIGVLRWREEYNVLSSVTGASRNSINGALWLGGEA